MNEPYLAARTFSRETIAARKLLADIGVDGSVPIAIARLRIGKKIDAANDNTDRKKVAA